MRGVLEAAIVLATFGSAAALVGSGTAAAVGVSLITGGARNHVESGMIALLDLGRALGGLLPNYSPRGKQVLGESISAKAQEAPRSGGAAIRLAIFGSIAAPTAIGISPSDY